ncbi:restriction endonuclease (plasmid) [Diaphorobacter sp. HDW4B]|uniref:restriction endonuclease n=1 Tax=Diaphorobacter sp. HDW4B TaxID=2714925 RepID=UPI00140DFC70|nr:restriction endonuclease [Diaphorobacter sp. HDW4B]QIL74256.1 restriction endonuclease [Diaphorobacter sp. HDW4B]
MTKNLVKKPKLGLGALTPEQFENLTFDLISSLGLQNVTWRTPGSDGGRDIEANEIGPDFSGLHVSKRWFIECKKYTGSVDWPTIYAKVAYADSHSADYLLMCTPSKYTPAAITQVANWNAGRRSLQIRLWAGHEIERQLLGFPDLVSKYGLAALPTAPGKSLLSLALGLSKSVSTYHSSLVFNDSPTDPMLEAAQLFADLLTQRVDDIEKKGRIQPCLQALPNSDRWAISGEQFMVDIFAGAAFLGYLSVLTRTRLAVEGTGTYSFRSTLDSAAAAAIMRYKSVFDAICLWGEMEYRVDFPNLHVNQRTALL